MVIVTVDDTSRRPSSTHPDESRSLSHGVLNPEHQPLPWTEWTWDQYEDVLSSPESGQALSADFFSQGMRDGMVQAASIIDETDETGILQAHQWRPSQIGLGSLDDLIRAHDEQTRFKKDKRRLQNRKAQQAYRARREQQVQKLEGLLVQVSTEYESRSVENKELHAALTKLRAEKQVLVGGLKLPEPDNTKVTGREFLQLAEHLLSVVGIEATSLDDQ